MPAPSSSQSTSALKSLLGMSGGALAKAVAASSVAPWSQSTGASATTSVSSQNSAASTASPAKSLREIQLEEAVESERQRQKAYEQTRAKQQHQHQLQQAQADQAAATAATLQAANWAANNNSTAAQKPKSSLREIMSREQEEIATADQSVSSDGQPRMVAGTWAAKIASPSAWSLNVTPTVAASAAPVPAPVLSTPAPTLAVPTIAAATSKPGPSSKPVPQAKGPKAAVAPSPPTPAPAPSEDFGGKGMSPAMAEWCTTAMRKLNGTDDITLLQFCMGVSSAVEIREYFSAYLGSTPQVSLFATEFIRRKEGSGSAAPHPTPSSAAQSGFVRVPGASSNAPATNTGSNKDKTAAKRGSGGDGGRRKT